MLFATKKRGPLVSTHGAAAEPLSPVNEIKKMINSVLTASGSHLGGSDKRAMLRGRTTLLLSSILLPLALSYPAGSVLKEAEEYLIKYGYLSEAQGDVKLAVR